MGNMVLESKRVFRRTIVNPGGLETLIDVMAVALLIFGIVISLIPLITASIAGVFVCLVGVFVSFAQWLLFRCIAEIIRLLKLQNGMSYRGKIETTDVTHLYACENCGMILHSPNQCESCGAVITGDATQPPEP